MVVIPTVVHAKCINEQYFINGIILKQTSSNTTQPTNNARVVIFFDNNKYGFSATTNENGAFSVEYLFNTYSGWLFGDECGKKPSSITVVVDVNNEYATKMMKYKIKDLSVEKNAKNIKIPNIILTWKEPYAE